MGVLPFCLCSVVVFVLFVFYICVELSFSLSYLLYFSVFQLLFNCNVLICFIHFQIGLRNKTFSKRSRIWLFRSWFGIWIQQSTGHRSKIAFGKGFFEQRAFFQKLI